MIVHRRGAYLLEVSRYSDPTTDQFYAWFSHEGRVLGFGKSDSRGDACICALNEFVDDNRQEKGNEDLDAFHAMRSHLLDIGEIVAVA